MLGTLAITGNADAVGGAAARGVRSAPGQPLYQPQLAQDRDGMLLKYLNLGYRNADIDVHVDFSPDRSRAERAVRGARRPAGARRSRARRRERAHEGRDGPARDRAAPRRSARVRQRGRKQRRISALGLFRRVRISEIDHGAAGSRDVLVTVEEAPATTLGYGGGVEVTRQLVRTSSNRGPRRTISIRAARIRRDRPPQPVRAQPIRQPVHARVSPRARRHASSLKTVCSQPQSSTSTGSSGLTASRASSVTPDFVASGVPRAGRPHELRLQSHAAPVPSSPGGSARDGA